MIEFLSTSPTLSNLFLSPSLLLFPPLGTLQFLEFAKSFLALSTLLLTFPLSRKDSPPPPHIHTQLMFIWPASIYPSNFVSCSPAEGGIFPQTMGFWAPELTQLAQSLGWKMKDVPAKYSQASVSTNQITILISQGS